MPFNPFSALTSKIFGGLALAFLAFAMVQTVRIEGVWCSDAAAGEKPACLVKGFKQALVIVRIDLADAEARARTEAAKHKATKQAYRDAQADAARIQAEVIATEVARQERITDAVRSDLNQRLVALRTRADRLRAQADAARGGRASGAAGEVRLSEDGDAAPGAVETPDCQRLPAPDVMTDIRCREIATEQATQLDALITWVQQQIGA